MGRASLRNALGQELSSGGVRLADDGGALVPSTWDPESRTIDMRVYGGEPVARATVFGEPYQLQLATGPDSVDLSRVESGLSLVVDHVDSAHQTIGTAVGSRFDDAGSPIVTFRLDDEVDGDPLAHVIRRVRSGIIRPVSVDARWSVDDMTVIEHDDGSPALVSVARWGLYHVAVVSTGASPTASVLSAISNPAAGVAAHPQEGDMSMQTQTGGGAPDPTATEAQLVAARKLERDRIAEINALAKKAELSADHAAVVAAIDGGLSAADASRTFVEAFAEARGHTGEIDTSRTVTLDADAANQSRLAIEDAVLFRMSRGATELKDRNNPWAMRPVMQIAEALGGRSPRGIDRDRAARLSMSEGDFPYVLAATANKILGDSYAAAMGTYQTWMRRRDLRDFKSYTVVRTGGAPALQLLPEGAQIKTAKMGETKESLQLLSYAIGVDFSRKMIIDDDLGAFADMLAELGAGVGYSLNSFAYSLLETPGTLSDGIALFHNDHANLGTNGALASDTLSELRQLLRDQTRVGGQAMNVPPRWLLVPSGQEGTAEKLLSDRYLPTSASTVVTDRMRSMFELVVDAQLADDGAYYGIADPMRAGHFAWGFREGAPGPQIDSQVNFSTKGIEYTVLVDWHVGIEDYRGITKNAGA